MTLILLGKFVPLDRSITTNQYLIICVIPQTAPPPPIMRMVYRMISGQSTCHDGWHAFLLTTVVHSDYLNYRSLPVSLSQVIFLFQQQSISHPQNHCSQDVFFVVVVFVPFSAKLLRLYSQLYIKTERCGLNGNCGPQEQAYMFTYM